MVDFTVTTGVDEVWERVPVPVLESFAVGMITGIDAEERVPVLVAVPLVLVEDLGVLVWLASTVEDSKEDMAEVEALNGKGIFADELR